MKIAINGYIIDTKNIYKIHEIDRNDLIRGNWNHSFIIESFNSSVVSKIGVFISLVLAIV